MDLMQEKSQIDYHAKVKKNLRKGPLVKTTVGPGYVEPEPGPGHEGAGARARRHDAISLPLTIPRELGVKIRD